MKIRLVDLDNKTRTKINQYFRKGYLEKKIDEDGYLYVEKSDLESVKTRFKKSGRPIKKI